MCFSLFKIKNQPKTGLWLHDEVNKTFWVLCFKLESVHFSCFLDVPFENCPNWIGGSGGGGVAKFPRERASGEGSGGSAQSRQPPSPLQWDPVSETESQVGFPSAAKVRTTATRSGEEAKFLACVSSITSCPSGPGGETSVGSKALGLTRAVTTYCWCVITGPG